MPDRPVVSAPTDETARALREIVWHSYSLITQGESPTQLRQGHARAIYDAAKRELARREARDDPGRPSVGAGT